MPYPPQSDGRTPHGYRIATAWLRTPEAGCYVVLRTLETLDHAGTTSCGEPSNYINRVADCLGVDLEPEMKHPQ